MSELEPGHLPRFYLSIPFFPLFRFTISWDGKNIKVHWWNKVVVATKGHITRCVFCFIFIFVINLGIPVASLFLGLASRPSLLRIVVDRQRALLLELRSGWGRPSSSDASSFEDARRLNF